MKTMSEKLDDDLSSGIIGESAYYAYHANLCKILERNTALRCHPEKVPDKEAIRNILGSSAEEEVIPIYFDYKIPDDRSVYYSVYNLGVFPHEEEITSIDFMSKLRRFVSNCRKIDYNKHENPKLRGLTYDSTKGTFNLNETEKYKFKGLGEFIAALEPTNCIMPLYKNEKVYRYYAAGEIRGYLIRVLLTEHIDKWIKPKMKTLYELIKKSESNNRATLEIVADILLPLELQDVQVLYFIELLTQLKKKDLVEGDVYTKITFKKIDEYDTTYKNIFINPTLDNDVIVNKVVHDLIYKTVMDEISQSGGNINYYKKYLKYKTKYLNLSRLKK